MRSAPNTSGGRGADAISDSFFAPLLGQNRTPSDLHHSEDRLSSAEATVGKQFELRENFPVLPPAADAALATSRRSNTTPARDPQAECATARTGVLASWFNDCRHRISEAFRMQLVPFELDPSINPDPSEMDSQSRWTMRYTNPQIEREFVRFYLRMQATTVVVVALAGTANLFILPLANVDVWAETSLADVCYTLGFMSQLALAVWIIYGMRRQGPPTSIAPSTEVIQANIKEMVISGAFVMTVLFSMVPRYQEGDISCAPGAPKSEIHTRCVDRIDYFLVTLMIVPSTLYNLRGVVTIPMMALSVASWCAGMSLSSYIAPYPVIVAQLVWYVSFLVMRTFDSQQRERSLRAIFRRYVEVEQANAQIARHRPFVGRILAATVPPPCAARIFNARSTDEAAACCFVPGGVVCVSDVFDFHRWANQRMPLQVIQVLHRIFSQYDKAVAHFKLAKVTTFGDMYVCVSGLEQERSPVEAFSILEFALWQVENATYVRRDLQGQFAVRVGVGTGSYLGGFAGRSTLRYSVAGDPLDNARSSVRYCVDGDQIVCCDRTKDTVDSVEAMIAASIGLAVTPKRFDFRPLPNVELAARPLFFVSRSTSASTVEHQGAEAFQQSWAANHMPTSNSGLFPASFPDADLPDSKGGTFTSPGLVHLRHFSGLEQPEPVVRPRDPPELSGGDARVSPSCFSRRVSMTAVSLAPLGRSRSPGGNAIGRVAQSRSRSRGINQSRRSPWNSLHAEHGIVRHRSSMDLHSSLASGQSAVYAHPALRAAPHEQLLVHGAAFALAMTTGSSFHVAPSTALFDVFSPAIEPRADDATPSENFWNDSPVADEAESSVDQGGQYRSETRDHRVLAAGLINDHVVSHPPSPLANRRARGSSTTARATYGRQEPAPSHESPTTLATVVDNTLRSLANDVRDTRERVVARFAISAFTLRFLDPTVESHYVKSQFADTRPVKMALLSQLVHIVMFMAAFFFVGRWGEHPNFDSTYMGPGDWQCFVGLAVAAALTLARLGMMQYTQIKLPSWLHAGWSGGALAIAVVSLQRIEYANILVNDVRYLIAVHFTICLPSYRQMRWYWLSLTFWVFSVLPISFVYAERRGHMTVFSSMLCLLMGSLATAFAHSQERTFRNRFTVGCYALTSRAMAADKLSTQLQLMHSVLPHHVVKRVMGSLQSADGVLPPFAEASRTLVVLRIRCSQVSVAPALPPGVTMNAEELLRLQLLATQQKFAAVSGGMDLIAAALRHCKCAATRSLELVQTIGDVFVIAGPFGCTICHDAEDGMHAAIPTVVKRQHAVTSLEKAAWDCVEVLRYLCKMLSGPDAANLAHAGITAVLDCEEAHGALMGDHTLQYHLFGVAMRQTASLLDATPDFLPSTCVAVATHGFRSVIERGDPVSKVLANIPASELSTTVNPVVDPLTATGHVTVGMQGAGSATTAAAAVFGPAMRWAARGAGVVRVYPIVLHHADDTEARRSGPDGRAPASD